MRPGGPRAQSLAAAMYATERLDVRGVEERDVDGLLGVYRSNPEVLALTEGSAGEPGRYDRGMLERDLWMSELDEARHTAGLFLRDGGACVGVIDWLEPDAAPRSLALSTLARKVLAVAGG